MDHIELLSMRMMCVTPVTFAFFIDLITKRSKEIEKKNVHSEFLLGFIWWTEKKLCVWIHIFDSC